MEVEVEMEGKGSMEAEMEARDSMEARVEVIWTVNDSSLKNVLTCSIIGKDLSRLVEKKLHIQIISSNNFKLLIFISLCKSISMSVL